MKPKPAPPEPIRRIGCIHFDRPGSANPIPTIKAALANCGDISDALIILPEALNLGDGYYDCQKRRRLVFSDGELQSLARQFNVAFVAGLAEKSPFETYNSAFLIDPERSVLLSRKKHDDPHARWYKGSGDTQCISYRDLILASLICQDATKFNPSPNTDPLHQRALDCLRSDQIKKSPVLCVPARMMDYDPAGVAKRWPQDVTVVIANINTTVEAWSGIRLASREWKPCLEGLCLEPLPSNDSVAS